MSWVNVSYAELNNFDIFAFVNMKDRIRHTGRIFNKCDGQKGLMRLHDNGEFDKLMDIPDWAKSTIEEDVMRVLYEAMADLPGSDLYNKTFNIEHENYTPEQLYDAALSVLKAAIEPPTCIILKYIPNLSLTEDMLSQFILTKD